MMLVMDVGEIPLFALADRRLAWVDRREALLSQNVANADTPGYKPRDLPPFDQALARIGLDLAPVRTNPAHLAGTAADTTGASLALSGEQAPDGNAVSLDAATGAHRRHRFRARAGDEPVRQIPRHVPDRDRPLGVTQRESGTGEKRTMDMDAALAVSARGMQAQATRLRVIAENLANQQTTGGAPGAAPYQRKTVTFADRMDRSLGVPTVAVSRIGTDPTPFPQRYDPSNPAADARGYVRMPNVNSFVEVMDMRDAQRSYDANLAVMQTTRAILTRTIAMLK